MNKIDLYQAYIFGGIAAFLAVMFASCRYMSIRGFTHDMQGNRVRSYQEYKEFSAGGFDSLVYWVSAIAAFVFVKSFPPNKEYFWYWVAVLAIVALIAIIKFVFSKTFLFCLLVAGMAIPGFLTIVFLIKFMLVQATCCAALCAISYFAYNFFFGKNQ